MSESGVGCLRTTGVVRTEVFQPSLCTSCATKGRDDPDTLTTLTDVGDRRLKEEELRF